MQTPNQRVGKFGEDAAAEFLASRGFEILERNYRCDIGEIDIIAKQGKSLIFAEVKTRTGGGYGHPFEAITHEKISRMRRLAQHWSSLHNFESLRIRLDAVSVLFRGGKVLIEHLKGVY
jgi:putative endonuclease